jgi:hypothetical protein
MKAAVIALVVLVGGMAVLAARNIAEQSAARERNEVDRLCAAIGETRVIALQPKDRVYFERNCVCSAGVCRGRESAEQRP